MMIDRLSLYNFGVYAGENIFTFSHERPVSLIGGMNGRGKTTFLEAVLLALYGPASPAFRESGASSYSAYLHALVHRGAPDARAWVELQFTEGGSQTYLIRREWTTRSRKGEECIDVQRDGEHDDFLTNNWAMFIENLLPCALSSFYFFDGEKIAELAVANTDKLLKESIRSMLGISVLTVLRHDLQRSIRQREKQHHGDEGSAELHELEAQRDALNGELQAAQGELGSLQAKYQQLNSAIESLQTEYETRGGLVAQQKQTYLQRRAELSAALEQSEANLLELSSGVLPLALVRELLVDIKLQAEDEHGNGVMRQSLSGMNALLEEYAHNAVGDASSGRRFLDFVQARIEAEQVEEVYALSEHALFQLGALTETELDAAQRAVRQEIAHKGELRRQLDEVDSCLNLDINEKELQALAERIHAKSEELQELQVSVKVQEQQAGKLKNRLMLLNAEYSRKLERWLGMLDRSDDNERYLRYAHLAQKILDQYEVALQAGKSAQLARTITDCYRQLANKKNLIKRIDMDPRTLEIQYLNAQGEEVPKESLSAGEKQLMVIAILWALAICSDKKLPVIIDTPLARLDSVHREALLRTYFPKAGRQTIILSTDVEIDRATYELIRDSVGDEYTLVYDEQTRSTSVRKGYFEP